MIGPDDSSLTATAITSRSGQSNKRAMPDNATSMILFRNELLMRTARARGRLLPLPTAFSYRSFRSVSEDARVAKFLHSTLRWRTTRPGDEVLWPMARL